MLTHENTPARTRLLLLLDALAPVAGIAAVRLAHPPEGALAPYLGFFAGFLLYIGAADILPEAHSEGSSALTVALTVLGACLAFAVSRVV
jgi:ZIP family zinc transporter